MAVNVHCPLVIQIHQSAGFYLTEWTGFDIRSRILELSTAVIRAAEAGLPS
jgi:hypothetical protein